MTDNTNVEIEEMFMLMDSHDLNGMRVTELADLQVDLANELIERNGRYSSAVFAINEDGIIYVKYKRPATQKEAEDMEVQAKEIAEMRRLMHKYGWDR